MDQNLPIDAPKILVVVQGAGASQAGQNPMQLSPPVSTNFFMRTLQGTLGFTTAQVQSLAEDRYDTQGILLYWKFIEIREFCQLKYNIPVISSCIAFRDRKIKFLHALAWWVTDIMLWG